MSNTNQNHSSKSFFLISFLPALAYWYLEEKYPVEIAVTGGIILGLLEMVLEKVFTKVVHSISKFNFFLIVALGAISIIGKNGVWFKLQPFFTGVIMSLYMLYKLKRGDGLFYEMMMMMNKEKVPPKEIVLRLEKHLAIFLLLYGVFMGVIAIWATTSQWRFFKMEGLYLCLGIFMVFEMILLRKKL